LTLLLVDLDVSNDEIDAIIAVINTKSFEDGVPPESKALKTSTDSHQIEFDTFW
jgi:hypothetical protein